MLFFSALSHWPPPIVRLLYLNSGALRTFWYAMPGWCLVRYRFAGSGNTRFGLPIGRRVAADRPRRVHVILRDDRRVRDAVGAEVLPGVHRLAVRAPGQPVAEMALNRLALPTMLWFVPTACVQVVANGELASPGWVLSGTGRS